MTTDLFDHIALSGACDERPAPLALHAGPLSLVYDDGSLRYLRLGDREVVRRIYLAVRERNWGTVPVQIKPVETTVREDSFSIVYDAVACQGEVDFAWHTEIRGDSAGRIEFTLDGEARSDFLRNRIGFCILHPPRECRAARCRVRLPDGQWRAGVFPDSISPKNPFCDFTGIMHEVEAARWCRLLFEGDQFEMEDQRNWVEASFKTFCTPLHLPFPVRVVRGTRVRQAVRLDWDRTPSTDPRSPVREDRENRFADPDPSEQQYSFETTPSSSRSSRSGLQEYKGDPTTIRVERSTDRRTPLPPIGLSVATHGERLAPAEIVCLSILRPAHLRVDLRLACADFSARLAQAAGETTALGCGLEAAIFVGPNPEEELRALASRVAELRPTIARWLVFHEAEHAASDLRWVNLARTFLTGLAPGAAFATGTDYWFAQLNRCRPPTATLDQICFSINPQVHSSDRSSLVETLEAHADVISTAKRFAGNAAIVVSPVTLRMRGNPAATGPRDPAPAGELPPEVDPRQMSLFGAGWTLGSVKYLAESGAASATYYETSGWLGVMERPNGSPLPAKFPSPAGAVFPLYHLLADVNHFSGGDVIPTRTSDPRRVEALELAKGAQHCLLLANLSPSEQHVDVCLPAGPALLRRLHPGNVRFAMTEPGAFRSDAAQPLTLQSTPYRLALAPFEFVRIDFSE